MNNIIQQAQDEIRERKYRDDIEYAKTLLQRLEQIREIEAQLVKQLDELSKK